jgi:hypothetical protein
MSRTQEPHRDKNDSNSGDANGSVAGAIGQGLAAAAQRSGLGDVASQDRPTGRALLAGMGGVRGLVETILPGFVFLLLYAFTASVPISVGASVGVALLFTIARIIGHTPVTQAVAGLIGVAASAVLSLVTGRGEDNFVLGLYTNGAYAVVLLVSILIGWPVIGLAVGYLMGDGLAWRGTRSKFRAMQVLTLCWMGLFVARLVVQLPLYFAGNVEGLAIAKLIMGPPLYGLLLLVSWLIVRAVYRPSAAAVVE